MSVQVKVLTGEVISSQRDKTIAVKIVRKTMHPKYKKYMTRSTKLHAHDEKNECQVGDIVSIRESKPFSKTKTWALVEIVEKNK